MNKIIIKAAAFFCLGLVLCQMGISATITIGKNREILVDGKPFFPIFVGMQNRSKISELKQYGFNTFFTQGDSSTALQYCDEAKNNNVYAVVHFKEDQVGPVKNHPALLGWVYADEPDMQGKDKKAPRIPMQESVSVYRKCKSMDPTHLMFLTLTTGYNKVTTDRNSEVTRGKDLDFYRDYAKATDVIGYDTYPIFGNMQPDCLWWVPSAAKELDKLMEGKKPLFSWIETNGGSKWITASKQRHPFPFEIRCEVWMSIVNGCNAIGYFTHTWVAMDKIGNPLYTKRGGYEGDYKQFGVPKDNCEELKKINKQITKLTPILCLANIKGKVKEEELSGGEVDIMVKQDNNSTYVFAVNMKRQKEKVKFTIEGLKKGTKIEVDEENRKIDAEDGFFTDDFTEHAVHIYKVQVK